jgi:hypothetical protein
MRIVQDFIADLNAQCFAVNSQGLACGHLAAIGGAHKVRTQ